jgi:hypothetical protein
MELDPSSMKAMGARQSVSSPSLNGAGEKIFGLFSDRIAGRSSAQMDGATIRHPIVITAL